MLHTFKTLGFGLLEEWEVSKWPTTLQEPIFFERVARRLSTMLSSLDSMGVGALVLFFV